MSNPVVQTMENKEAVANIKAMAPNTGTPKPAAAPSEVTPEVLTELLVKFKELKEKNEELSAKVAAATPALIKKPAAQKMNWENINEQDIFAMDIPVQTIEHSLETYLDVYLADKNYVPRWVHKSQHNIGPKLNRGYSFVTAEDLDSSKKHALLFDANGHYSFDDVICLKISKAIYFGKIKANFNRATSIQRGKEVRAKNLNQDINLDAISDNPYVSAAQQKGSLQFYEPSAPSLTVASQVG